MKLSDLNLDIPSLNGQPGRPCPKGKSRLEVQADAKPLTVITDAAFKKIVRTRDRLRCRKCGCKVEVTMKRQANRAEVHHIHGRLGALAFEDRAALLLCLCCHERVTGRVNDKLVIVGTQLFELQTKVGVQTCIDARFPVRFESVIG